MNKTIVWALALGLGLAALAWAAGSREGGIGPDEARALMAKEPKAVMLDVRTPEEYAAGHIAGAKLLPYQSIDRASAAAAVGSPETPVVVYCRSGHRSGIAAATLRGLGYTRVYDLGPVSAWKEPLAK